MLVMLLCVVLCTQQKTVETEVVKVTLYISLACNIYIYVCIYLGNAGNLTNNNKSI